MHLKINKILVRAMDSRESVNLLHSDLPGQGKNCGEHLPVQIPFGKREFVEDIPARLESGIETGLHVEERDVLCRSLLSPQGDTA